jgi:hypothetical protein
MKQQFSPIEILSVTSLPSLTPTQLHRFLRILIHYEVQPGGPYVFPVPYKKNRQLNSHIASLVKPLPSQSNKPRVPQGLQAKLQSILEPSEYECIVPLVKRIGVVNTNGELTQLTKSFVRSLREAPNKYISSNDSLELMGEANFLIWVAYSIYDQLLDGNNNPIQMPLAHQIIRRAVSMYHKASIPIDDIYEYLDEVDRANYKELSNCTMKLDGGSIAIPVLESSEIQRQLLATRSIAHCIGLLHTCKNSFSTQQFHISKKIMYEYCAARQFNDDIHDWEEDLRNGRLTYVVLTLLQMEGIQPGVHSLEALIVQLQLCFWRQGLETLVQECLNRANAVRKAYIEHLGLKERSHFDTITISPLITACNSALATHRYEKKFLEIMRVERHNAQDANG